MSTDINSEYRTASMVEMTYSHFDKIDDRACKFCQNHYGKGVQQVSFIHKGKKIHMGVNSNSKISAMTI